MIVTPSKNQSQTVGQQGVAMYRPGPIAKVLVDYAAPRKGYVLSSPTAAAAAGGVTS